MYVLGVGQLAQRSSLLKYCDDIIQPPLHLSTHIMEARVRILETYKNSEEISFYHIFLCICRLLQWLCWAETVMYWLQHFITSISRVSIYNWRKPKISETNKKPEVIAHVYLIFCSFGDFNCDVVKRKHPLGCTKMRSPRIGTILRWRPPVLFI